MILDLADPDTLAAFDRRLAVRLGCPPEAAAEGVIVSVDETTEPEGDEVLWDCNAGGEAARRFPGGAESWPKWNGRSMWVDTTDPLLARIHLWTSVTP